MLHEHLALIKAEAVAMLTSDYKKVFQYTMKLKLRLYKWQIQWQRVL